MKKTIVVSVILSFILALRILAAFPESVEQFYSNGMYPLLAQTLRFSWGWIPFSVGDILYALAISWMLYRIYLFFSRPKAQIQNYSYAIFIIASSIYLIFYIFWGLNYYRISVTEKLQLHKEYTSEELISLTRTLIRKSNEAQFKITSNINEAVQNPYSHRNIMDKAHIGYDNLSTIHPFLQFTTSSCKTSLWSTPLTYMGFSGYLNPFTNEAQVNDLIPLYNFPTTTCHEMAHQIGIASESEANLIGHLASTHHSDLYFIYSGYTYALRYCLSEIYHQDEILFKILEKEINPGILKNFEETEHLWMQYESPIERISKKIYGNYLELNQQKGGMKTYNRFVGLMINYYSTHAL